MNGRARENDFEKNMPYTLYSKHTNRDHVFTERYCCECVRTAVNWNLVEWKAERANEHPTWVSGVGQSKTLTIRHHFVESCTIVWINQNRCSWLWAMNWSSKKRAQAKVSNLFFTLKNGVKWTTKLNQYDQLKVLFKYLTWIVWQIQLMLIFCVCSKWSISNQTEKMLGKLVYVLETVNVVYATSIKVYTFFSTLSIMLFFPPNLCKSTLKCHNVCIRNGKICANSNLNGLQFV